MRRSDLLFHAGGECVAQYGTIMRKTLRSDDTGYTHTRGSTQSYTFNGSSLWAAANIPTVTYNGGVPALKMTTADVFYAPYHHTPQALTVYARFIERGTISGASNRILQIGSSNGATVPYLAVLTTGTYYRATVDTSGTDATATLAVAPTTGQLVELRATLAANGGVTIGQSIASGAETLASSTANATMPAAWADTRLYINSGGSASRGKAHFEAIKVARGIKTLAEMRAL